MTGKKRFLSSILVSLSLLTPGVWGSDAAQADTFETQAKDQTVAFEFKDSKKHHKNKSHHKDKDHNKFRRRRHRRSSRRFRGHRRFGKHSRFGRRRRFRGHRRFGIKTFKHGHF